MNWKSAILSMFFAVMAVVSMSAQPAQATLNGWMMCWVPGESAGGHECVRLPDNWRINGVTKRRCSSANHFCSRAVETFQINRSNLRSVARYANVGKTDLGSVATIYTGVYR